MKHVQLELSVQHVSTQARANQVPVTQAAHAAEYALHVLAMRALGELFHVVVLPILSFVPASHVLLRP